jgi:hypothetical protein
MAPAACSTAATGSRARRGLAKVMAQEERLGEVRLYRIPINVTVASRSQKQVALLERPAVRVTTVMRFEAR